MSSSSRLRGTLKKLPAFRSTFYLGMVLRQMVEDQWKEPGSFDDIFGSSEDPWDSRSESERERFAVTLETLAAAETSRFHAALELGCAEGIFTEKLAPMCDRLTGFDFSEVALVRARARLADNGNVELKRWDMRTEPIEGSYDLVVAMGVITSLYRPRDVRNISRSIVAALVPHGYLLFSDVRQSRVFETSWWGPMMLRGGEQIRRYLTALPDLDVIHTADTDSHVFALYRRRART